MNSRVKRVKNIINRIKNDKVLFFLSILIIGVFLVLIIRITYSYLAASINEATGGIRACTGLISFRFCNISK